MADEIVSAVEAAAKGAAESAIKADVAKEVTAVKADVVQEKAAVVAAVDAKALSLWGRVKAWFAKVKARL